MTPASPIARKLIQKGGVARAKGHTAMIVPDDASPKQARDQVFAYRPVHD
jgi:hypothetical protein